MYMKKIFLLFFVFTGSFLFPQDAAEFNNGFISLFKNYNEFNSYYFGGNPALLSVLPDDELLSLKTSIDMDDGKFKKFIEPESGKIYQVFASGKKAIDENQRFRGSFGFQREERGKWNWFFTRDYQSGNPFLIGDSTSGKSRINGILMNAGYAINLTEKFSTGISLDYSVDEMLKEVSPKPTSVHRDIRARLGVNYALTGAFNFGLITDVYDKTERISYSEDEGSVTQETIILKFKGYDFPNVFRKKTETRYSYINGYSAGFTSSYIVLGLYTVTAYLTSGFDKTNLKDDATNPKAEGFWKNDFVDAGLQFTYKNKELLAALTYYFRSDDGWGKYSPYNVLYYEKENASHSFVVGLQYPLSKNIRGGVEGGLMLNKLKENDHYSVILLDSKSRLFFGKAGLSVKWNNELSTLISYGYYSNSIPDYSYSTNVISDYYNLYRQYDIQYMITAYKKHEFTLSSSIDPGIGGMFLIHLNYSISKPVSGSVFGNETKNRFNSVIEYRVKVY